MIAQMIDDILRREGGYVDHSADRGGPTNHGITQATLADWRGCSVSAADIEALGVDEARAIYEARYWRDPGIDKLPDLIQPFVFDAAVNHGPAQAVKLVQEACWMARFNPGPVDGVIGSRTIGAAQRYARAFLDALIDHRQSFYRDIVRRDPSQAVFIDGWLNRLEEFRQAKESKS